MKEAKSQSESPENRSNTKKTTVEREFFVCFCAKSYNSYSALYLHARKKHEQSISMNCLKFKKHEWSGNVKNIYYEFVEEDVSNESKEEESIIISAPRKKVSKESSKIQAGASFCDNATKCSEKPEFLSRLNNLFHKYIENSDKSRILEIRKCVIEDFLKWITEHWQQVFPDKKEENQNKNIDFNFIPHLLNNFHSYYFPKNICCQKQLVEELAAFSEWLYSHSYTKYLAIEDRRYREFFESAEHEEKKYTN